MTPQMISANGLAFETFTAGDATKPLVLFLHGFPEHAGAWSDVASRFSDCYFSVAPNQRGYGRSSKPPRTDDYRVQHLAKDMLSLADVLSPRRPFHLVAHDWGASVAYMMAFVAPARIMSLTVANGVHPLPFQNAILTDPEQRAASQYMRFLRRDDAAELLRADNFRRLLRFMTEGFGGGTWMTDAQKAAYIEAWSQPGALEAMVSWYKATTLVVPVPDEVIADNPMARINPDMVRVRMPHLLLWGREDKALRPSCIAGLETYCDDLTVKHIEGADHWIIHQQPAQVTAHMRAFIDARPTHQH